MFDVQVRLIVVVVGITQAQRHGRATFEVGLVQALAPQNNIHSLHE